MPSMKGSGVFAPPREDFLTAEIPAYMRKG